MELAGRIAELEALIAEDRLAITRATARLVGHEAELAALRGAVASPGALASLSRTDAIIAVLRGAAATLSPTEVVQRLAEGGRAGDTDRDVSATLTYLLNQGRVQRPERGRYLAT